MELEDRVTALEDEVGIINGEIKSIIVAMRNALVAQNSAPGTHALGQAARPQLASPKP